jgi:transcriptional antiterminator RfaH
MNSNKKPLNHQYSNSNSKAENVVGEIETRNTHGTEQKDKTIKAWYLLQCKARQDNRAEENLARQGYTYFRPKIIKKHDSSNEKTNHQSLFPSYIFIQLGIKDNWGALRSTKGILKLVKFGEHPQAVEATVIEQIKDRLESLAKIEDDTDESPSQLKNISKTLDMIFSTPHGDIRAGLLLALVRKKIKA